MDEWPEHAKSLQDVVSKTTIKVNAPVIGTDVVGEITKGPWAGRTFGGQSVASDKKGNILAICKDRDRDVKIVTIELSKS